jgi:hypothetical protein
MEAVGRLAGGIAHDFNNMLMAIGSSVAVALRDLEPDCRAHRCLTEVERAAERAAALTRQPDLSRKEAIARDSILKRLALRRAGRDRRREVALEITLAPAGSRPLTREWNGGANLAERAASSPRANSAIRRSISG